MGLPIVIGNIQAEIQRQIVRFALRKNCLCPLIEDDIDFETTP